jgi:hypothetical protein
MPKRKYKKKSDYWNKFDPNKKDLEDIFTEDGRRLHEIVASAGESYYEAVASGYQRHSTNKGGGSTGSRSNVAADSNYQNRFANISSGMLPWAHTGSYITVQDTILLCQKAYANIAIFRNALDIMAEFANSEIYLEGGTAKSREFLYKWFEKFRIWDLKDQYFREYYRSGNVFMYRLDGKFDTEDYAKMSTVYGAAEDRYPWNTKDFRTFGLKPGHLPIKYVMLNPYDIIATRALTFYYGRYFKILSEYEIESLKDPKTDHDKEIYDSLPPDIRKKIKNNQWSQDGIMMLLDPGKLIYSFYKKQDYEPFAIPFGFSVLDDINWKIELKKMDQAITRTVENVILLVTMGNEPDKGGINPLNFQAMQSLFQNESVGRVLISDYTTKADFIIPDLKKVLGPEKYDIVNNDIREGLQNIIVGEEKFSNKQIKADIFFERLREARKAFLNDFLQPQIKMVCKAMGFRKFPIPKFADKDIKDEVQFHRVTTRLMELGILTPTQGMEAMQTGLLPRSSDLDEAQEGYVKDREKGYYNPLVGGVPAVEAPGAPLERDMKEKIAEEEVYDRRAGPIPEGPAPPISPTPNETGRPKGATAAELYSRDGIQQTVVATEGLIKFTESKMKEEHNIKRISKQKKEFISSLCENVISAKSKNEWEEAVAACIAEPNKMADLTALPGVSEIAVAHDLGFYPAALLYHSKNTDGNK